MINKNNIETLEKIIKRFSKKKLLVIGDLLLDKFIWGEVSRISPEAPVPVVWVKKEHSMPGGACNVANNIAQLGAQVSIVGVVGEDKNADILIEQLKENSIITKGVFTIKERPTIVKTRVIANNQQVVRIDREHINEIKGKYFKKIKNYLEENIQDFDGIIIEDYGKGLITSDLLKTVVPLAKKYKKMVAVDPKESHFLYYKAVSVITPNYHETEKAVGFSIDSEEKLRKAGNLLLKKTKAEVVLLTLGEKGMMVFEKGKNPNKISTVAQEVFDVSGAGDTVISVYSLAIVSGANALMAAYLANCAAGIVVGKIGVAVVKKEELLKKTKQEIKKR